MFINSLWNTLSVCMSVCKWERFNVLSVRRTTSVLLLTDKTKRPIILLHPLHMFFSHRVWPWRDSYRLVWSVGPNWPFLYQCISLTTPWSYHSQHITIVSDTATSHRSSASNHDIIQDVFSTTVAPEIDMLAWRKTLHFLYINPQLENWRGTISWMLWEVRAK